MQLSIVTLKQSRYRISVTTWTLHAKTQPWDKRELEHSSMVPSPRNRILAQQNIIIGIAVALSRQHDGRNAMPEMRSKKMFPFGHVNSSGNTTLVESSSFFWTCLGILEPTCIHLTLGLTVRLCTVAALMRWCHIDAYTVQNLLETPMYSAYSRSLQAS